MANTKVYFPQGGSKMVVASGGEIDVESGGSLKFGSVAMTGNVRAGTQTVSAAHASAGSVAITTGLSSITAMFVMVLTAGNNVDTADADVTASGGTITVANGTTYNTTATDVIHWIAVGS